jgi:hypothetical protein
VGEKTNVTVRVGESVGTLGQQKKKTAQRIAE